MLQAAFGTKICQSALWPRYMAPIGASENLTRKLFIAASDDVQLDAICLLCGDNGGSKITTVSRRALANPH